MAHWFAVRTKPRREFYAKEQLMRQGHTVYLPVVRRLVSHARRRRLASRPFFTGYLFILLEPDQANWTAINSTYGVACVVRFGDYYPPVPLELIEGLRAREDGSGHVVLPEELASPFRPGARVRVRVGEADIEGIFAGLDGEERARVLIELLGRQQDLTVPVEAVSAL